MNQKYRNQWISTYDLICCVFEDLPIDWTMLFEMKMRTKIQSVEIDRSTCRTIEANLKFNWSECTHTNTLAQNLIQKRWKLHIHWQQHKYIDTGICHCYSLMSRNKGVNKKIYANATELSLNVKRMETILRGVA